VCWCCEWFDYSRCCVVVIFPTSFHDFPRISWGGGDICDVNKGGRGTPPGATAAHAQTAVPPVYLKDAPPPDIR
jgi:hypothetical protein